MSSGEFTEEKRRHIRFPVQFRSTFSSVNVVGGEGEGTLGDLSVRGCRWKAVPSSRRALRFN